MKLKVQMMINSENTSGKKFWQSKTFWVNLVSIAGLVTQSYTGYVIDPAAQGILLGSVNGLLRLATKEPVVWR